MNLVDIAILNFYSLLFLLIILHQYVQQADFKTPQKRLIVAMMIMNAAMLVLDVTGRFDGHFHPAAPAINHISNFLLYFFSPVLPALWLLYVVFEQRRELQNPARLLLAVVGIHGLAVITSLHTGWFYTIDANNVFKRGPYYILSAGLMAVLLGISIVSVIIYRRRIDVNHYKSLALFPVPPLMAVFLQSVFYGKSLMLNAGVLSLLMLHLNVLSKSMEKDELTQAANRKTLLMHLKKKMEQCADGKSFSAMLMDLDGFKTINDRFGHQTGDDALQSFSRLVRSCLGPDDLFARYGGDEFCVVLETPDAKTLEGVVMAIQTRLSEFNKQNDKPYRLAISIGHAVCRQAGQNKPEDFLEQLDKLMYEDKKTKQNLR